MVEAAEKWRKKQQCTNAITKQMNSQLCDNYIANRKMGHAQSTSEMTGSQRHQNSNTELELAWTRVSQSNRTKTPNGKLLERWIPPKNNYFFEK